LPIYSEDWNAWSDPAIPEYVNATDLLLDRHIQGGRADKTALISDGEAISYRALLDEVCRAANGLRAAGLPVQSRILVSATDTLASVAIWLAAVRAGLVPVSISDLYKTDQLVYFIRDTAATAIFIDDRQLAKIIEAQDVLPATLRTILVNGSAPGAADVTRAGLRVTTYSALVHGQAAQFDAVALHANDISYMFYSGGTTGTPKGITHLAHDFILVPERQGFWWSYTESDIVFATSKKYFTHGLWPGLLIPLYWGGTAIVISGNPTPAKLSATIETHGPTKLITVPTVIKLLLAHFDEHGLEPDFSSLSAVYTASEKMPPEVFERWHRRFGLELFDSIGSSEVTYEWIANRPSDFRRGSLGRPIVGVEIRLVDDIGNTISTPDTSGECLVKSRTACLFYWRKFDETKATFQGEWVRTGDHLRFDKDGYFWFAGRSNDVFKVKGLWVSPIEVEAAITRDERVLEAAVFAIDGSDGLCKVKAHVVLRAQASGNAAMTHELKDRVRRECGGYKVPDDIVFVAALPRTPLQKIDRRTLRELEMAAARPARLG
jgi:benzoate-CoA ligase